MSFWKMAPKAPPKKLSKDDTGKEAEKATDKPLPDPSSQLPQRPGTSGTEMALMTSRRRASEKYQQAQRAERTYVAKKRSAIARADRAEAKLHFREAGRHFKLAVRMYLSALKNARYSFSEKGEARRAKADEARRKKALDKKKKLEEALARETAAASDAGDDDTDKPADATS